MGDGIAGFTSRSPCPCRESGWEPPPALWATSPTGGRAVTTATLRTHSSPPLSSFRTNVRNLGAGGGPARTRLVRDSGAHLPCHSAPTNPTEIPLYVRDDDGRGGGQRQTASYGQNVTALSLRWVPTVGSWGSARRVEARPAADDGPHGFASPMVRLFAYPTSTGPYAHAFTPACRAEA
jgi:hypothetical protein